MHSSSKLNLDMVPRVEGDVVQPEDKSVVELYTIHLECSQKINLAKTQKPSIPDSTDGRPVAYPTLSKISTMRRNSEALLKGQSSHLFLTFHKLCLDVGDPASLSFALYEPGKGCYIRLVLLIF